MFYIAAFYIIILFEILNAFFSKLYFFKLVNTISQKLLNQSISIFTYM